MLESFGSVSLVTLEGPAGIVTVPVLPESTGALLLALAVPELSTLVSEAVMD